MSAANAFPTTGARERRRPLTLFSIFSFPIFAFPVALFLAGCSGGDGGSGGRGAASRAAGGASASLEEARGAAEAALEEAKAAKAGEFLPDDFERAQKRLEEAKDLVLSGKIDDATRRYILAKNSLETLSRRAGEVASALEEVEPAKKKAEEARTKAEEAQAAENAPEDFREAERMYGIALASYKERSREGARKALQEFRQAESIFVAAADRARDNAITRDQALVMKERMASQKEQAQEHDAHTKDILVWQNGESVELRADGEMQRGNFQRALQLYQEALNQYAVALKNVVDAAKYAELQKEQTERDEELRKEELARQEKLLEQFGRGRTTPSQPPSGSGTFQPGARPGIQQVRITASCFDGLDFSIYSDQLDAEREAYLQKHLPKLTPLGAPSYDPATGQIELDYQLGRLVAAEVNTLKTPEKHIEWEDWMASQYKSIEELKKAGSFAMGGNTDGFILFPVPFQNGVRITFDMNLQTMTGSGDFGVVLNFKDGAYFRTNFLDIGLQPARGPTKWNRMPGKHTGTNANYWVDKTKHVTWEIVFEMPDPSLKDKGPLESSQITVTYDKGNRLKEISRSISAGTAMTSGFVGLTWTQVKFRLFNLNICGIMDKDATVELLPLKGAPPPPAPRPEDKSSTTTSTGADGGEVETSGEEIQPIEDL